jgi:hypothetical protein
VIASPASKSTARSGNIAPWHLSHVFMFFNLSFPQSGAYPPEVLDYEMKEFPYRLVRLVRLGRCHLCLFMQKRPVSLLTGFTPSHRIVVTSMTDYHV